jgi:hypothetical protein
MFSSALLRLPVPTLMTFDVDDLARSISFEGTGPQHLRFFPKGRIVAQHFDHLLALVDIASPPRSLHLPVLPSDQRDLMRVSMAVFELVRKCLELKIEILYSESEDEDVYAVSPSFWRYAKRIKAEEAAAKGAARV